MKTMMYWVMLALMLCVLSGCLITQRSKTEESGTRISQATLEQVEPGRTSEKWLRAVLGEPTSRQRVDERTDILRYNFSRETTKGGAVFLVFAGQSSTKETATTYFEITDSIVTRHWTDS